LSAVDTVDVSSGWNLIGSISSPLPVTMIQSEGGTGCMDCASMSSDGYQDLTINFSISAIVAGLYARDVSIGECKELTLTGQLLDGTFIEGTFIEGKDFVQIVSPGSVNPASHITFKHQPKLAQILITSNNPNPFNPANSIHYNLSEDFYTF
jgi:hypothetical protein